MSLLNWHINCIGGGWGNYAAISTFSIQNVLVHMSCAQQTNALKLEISSKNTIQCISGKDQDMILCQECSTMTCIVWAYTCTLQSSYGNCKLF